MLLISVWPFPHFVAGITEVRSGSQCFTGFPGYITNKLTGRMAHKCRKRLQHRALKNPHMMSVSYSFVQGALCSV